MKTRKHSLAPAPLQEPALSSKPNVPRPGVASKGFFHSFRASAVRFCLSDSARLDDFGDPGDSRALRGPLPPPPYVHPIPPKVTQSTQDSAEGRKPESAKPAFSHLPKPKPNPKGELWSTTAPSPPEITSISRLRTMGWRCPRLCHKELFSVFLCMPSCPSWLMVLPFRLRAHDPSAIG